LKVNFVIIFIFCFKFIFSQTDSSKAVIWFKQKNAIIYLDNVKIKSKKELRKISVGTHKIKAWAPKYDLYTDSFVIKPKQNEFYSKKLVHADSYLRYRTQKRLSNLTYAVPAILAIGFASAYLKTYKELDTKIVRSYNEALDIKDLYYNSFSPDEFEKNYSDYYLKMNQYKDFQDKQKKIKNQGIIISSIFAATAVTALIIKLVHKKTKYEQVPLLARVTPCYNPLNKQICLTINLY
jgi:hypothetical protein